MSFWNKIDSFLKQPTATVDVTGDKQILAMAALLLEVAASDDDLSNDEQNCIMRILQNHFDLTELAAKDIIAEAHDDRVHATDLHTFTRVLTSELDQEERQDIILAIWKVILADDIIETGEDNLVRKICYLLGVSQHHSVELRHDAAAEIKSEI